MMKNMMKNKAEFIFCVRHCDWYGDKLLRCMSCAEKYFNAKGIPMDKLTITGEE